MNCKNCGTSNNIDAKFCIRCGTRLIDVQNNQITSNQASISNNQSNFNAKINKPKQKSKKMLFLGIIIVLIILVAIGVFLYSKINKGTSSVTISPIFNPDQPILVKKDGKYGYIDTDGKFVIEPKYASADNFKGKYAIVYGKIVVDGVENSKYQVIDTKGNVKATSDYSSNIEYFSDYDIWIINGKLYNGSLEIISPDDVVVGYEKYGYLNWEKDSNKTAGIMNSKGKITYTYNYVGSDHYIDIQPSSNDNTLKERYCRVNIDNKKYAIVNCDTGNVVYDFTDKYISTDGDNIFHISDHSTFEPISTLYIQNNKIAYQSENNKVYLNYYSSGYIEIKDYNQDYSNRYSYYVIKTGEIVKERPKTNVNTTSSTNKWEEFTGLKEYSCSTGLGLMKNDKVIVPCEWYDIDYFDMQLYQYLKSNGKEYVIAENNDKTYLVNLKDGKTVAEFNSSSVYYSDDNTFIEYTDKDTKKKVIYNILSGNSIEIKDSFSILTYANYIKVMENDKTNYYNINLKLIYTEEK